MTIIDDRPQPRHPQEGHDVHCADLLHRPPSEPLAAMLGLLPEPGMTSPAQALPCQENPAELWFAERPAEVEEAKALCLGCPIREACLAGALHRHEPWGVWGGQLLLQGVVVARKRPRGRPRKNDVAAA